MSHHFENSSFVIVGQLCPKILEFYSGHFLQLIGLEHFSTLNVSFFLFSSDRLVRIWKPSPTLDDQIQELSASKS